MIEQIKTDLEVLYQLKPRRLKHIYGVRDKALELGKRFSLDLDKLECASLLHDITKYYTNEENKALIKEHYSNSEEILKEYNEQILHAFSARIIAKVTYGITDNDILDSIESHTVGKPHMSMYEKVIFISDYTEINRKYDSCVRVREILKENIDLAVFTAIDDSIRFYEELNDMIPKTAYEARDYYKELLEVQHG